MPGALILVYWCPGVLVCWCTCALSQFRTQLSCLILDPPMICYVFFRLKIDPTMICQILNSEFTHARLARLGFERSGNLSSNMTEILRDSLKSKDIGEMGAKIDDIYLVFKILGPKFAQVVVEPKMARIVGSPSPEWGDSTYNTSSFLHTFFIIRIIWSSSVGKENKIYLNYKTLFTWNWVKIVFLICLVFCCCWNKSKIAWEHWQQSRPLPD